MRDLELPKHRLHLIRTIEMDLLNDENVLAVYYGGSIGNKNTDLYSDIDLRVVITDGQFENYRLNKKQRAKKWGNVIFFEDFPWTTYSIAHFDNFIKVDTFYYRLKDIQPSIWLQNIKIVHDTTGSMQEILDQSMKLTYQATAQEIEIWRGKFFAYIHEAYRRLMREEIYYALNCLDDIRLSIVTGWYMEAGIQQNTFGDCAKIEGKRSKFQDWQLTLLEQWHSIRNPHEMMNTIKKIIPEFIKIHKKLCLQCNVKENPNVVNDILNLI